MSPNHTYAASGTYTVTLTVTDDRGGQATLSRDVTVVANAKPTAAFTSSATFLSVSFDGSGSGDPDGSVATKFGIFNAERKAASRYTFIFGEGNKILHVFAKVNTENHGSEVAAKLKELGIPEAK